MITALIHAEGTSQELALTLGALVPAVVEGLMGDAVVVVPQHDAAVASIADFAGASLVVAAPDVDPWRAGASVARREWLLCLRSGDAPGEGWMRAVDRFFTGAIRAGHPLGRFSRTGAASIFVDLAERMAGTRTARAGDLVRRDWLATRERARVRPVRIAAAIERDSAPR